MPLSDLARIVHGQLIKTVLLGHKGHKGHKALKDHAGHKGHKGHKGKLDHKGHKGQLAHKDHKDQVIDIQLQVAQALLLVQELNL
jgi:hypothetical protein